MRVVLFRHSPVSDWIHGNAPFLRGVVPELLSRGHTVPVYRPSNGWSRMNLISAYRVDELLAVHREIASSRRRRGTPIP